MLVAAFGYAPAASAMQVQRRAAPVQRAQPQAPVGAIEAQLIPVTYEVRRPDDFLWLNYRLHNIRVLGSAPNQVITRANAQKPAWIVVEHQPQSIEEGAYWQNINGYPKKFPDDPPGAQSLDGENPPLPPGVTISKLSGMSRLVFQMPPDITEAGWGLEGLLDACQTWPMRLSPLAKPPPANFQKFIVPQQIFKLSQRRLDGAAQVLLANLPADQRAALGAVMPDASRRVADKINSAASAGKNLTDEEVDTIIGDELSASLAHAKTTQTVEQSFLSRRALEAAAASVSLSSLTYVSQSTRSLQRRTLPTELENVLVNPNLQALAPLGPREPEGDVTAIELPYRLVQTPLASAGWRHAVGPVTHSSRTEIWHTRLGTRKSGGVEDMSPEPLRAIWTPDYPTAKSGFGVIPRTPLYGDERRDIVRLTAGFNEKNMAGNTFTPRPTTAKQLMLTSLGAWLDLDGNWSDRPGQKNVEGQTLPSVDIINWSHKAAMARDYFVRVVKAGRLFPFGHAASLVRITERKFEPRGAGRVAVLRQRAFIIVREPVREYTGSNQQHEGRDFPFRRIEILTKRSPDLSPPGQSSCDRVFEPTPHDVAFVPVVGGKDFLFRLVGTDGAGRRIPFSAPLVLVLDSKNQPGPIEDVIKFYSGEQSYWASKPGSCGAAKKQRAVVPMNGAIIQYALQASGGDPEGDTNIPTESITFKGAAPTGGVAFDQPKYFPAIEEAKVILPSVKNLLGADKSPTVSYHRKYLESEFGGANAKAQLFLNIGNPDSHKVSVSEAEPSDKFGGMVTPDLSPSALSRGFGVVSGAAPANAPNGAAANAESFLSSFNPEDFLPNAKLLGAIELKDILKVITDFVGDKAQIPQFKTFELPESVEARYSLEQQDLGNVEPIFEAMPGSRLKIDTKVIAYRNGNPPESKVEGLVENFQINLFSCLILTFDKLSFVTVPGQKPKVDVDLDPEYGVMFGGPLEFINELKDIIPSGGFSDPSPISLTPTGITAGYSLAIPTIQVGICSISNISIGAAFSIPFTGAPPSARFNFAERHSPFNITVSLFGGGGFVAVVIDTSGMKEIEASLEFGAKIEIDLGVASGGVYVKGGFYFHLEQETGQGGELVQSIYFEGFVEMGGHLSIIGLISVSLTFHLALAYEKDGVAKTSRLFGQASLTVEVEVLFFSASVTVKVQRKFAGSEADPLFVDFIPNNNVWREYCEAFA